MGELSLDIRKNSNFVNGLLKKMDLIGDINEKFIIKLEDEYKRIQVFHSQFPLSIFLLNDAISVLKQESTQYRMEPVLEQFIPLKTDQNDTEINRGDTADDDLNTDNKKNWLSSVQLWNSDHVISAKTDYTHQNVNKTPVSDFDQVEEKRNKSLEPMTCIPMIHTCPRLPQLGRNPTKDQQLTSRKQRRCWSPELHRRFVDALTRLGGPLVATPKQIRELMRVDGLTNDEVKSHLQKYRLHTRRATTTSWTTPGQHGEPTKPGGSQSGSPLGPLQFSSMDEEDDEKSESCSWRSQVDRPSESTTT